MDVLHYTVYYGNTVLYVQNVFGFGWNNISNSGVEHFGIAYSRLLRKCAFYTTEYEATHFKQMHLFESSEQQHKPQMVQSTETLVSK